MSKTAQWWHSPQCILGLFPAWFASSPPDWPEALCQTQFPIWDEGHDREPGEELRAFLAAGELPIVFTPGSANLRGGRFFEAAVDVCRQTNRRGLLVSRFREHIPPDLPSGVRHIEFASFRWLLPRAAAIVHHGGIGTTAHALAAGIPQVITPFSHDQPDNAARIERLNLGRRLRRSSLLSRALVELVEYVLSSSQIHRACQAAQERIAAVDPFAESCDVIERAIPLQLRDSTHPDPEGGA